MAKQLITSMTSPGNPEEYTDEYHKALEKLIEEKIEHGDKTVPGPEKRKKPTSIVDLVSVLQASIQETHGAKKNAKTGAKPKAKATPAKPKSETRKKAA